MAVQPSVALVLLQLTYILKSCTLGINYQETLLEIEYLVELFLNTSLCLQQCCKLQHATTFYLQLPFSFKYESNQILQSQRLFIVRIIDVSLVRSSMTTQQTHYLPQIPSVVNGYVCDTFFFFLKYVSFTRDKSPNNMRQFPRIACWY